MNNQIPFFYPFNINNLNYEEYQKMNNRISELEKKITIIEEKIKSLKLEDNDYNQGNEPTDMYII